MTLEHRGLEVWGEAAALWEGLAGKHSKEPRYRVALGKCRLNRGQLFGKEGQAALDKVPGLDPATLDDLMLGCAEPEAKQGVNMARRVAVALGYDALPGTTVNRFCASSVQTSRMAFHAIRSGEGHAFVSAGVECVSQYPAFNGAGAGREEFLDPAFDEARARTEATAASHQTWRDPREDGSSACGADFQRPTPWYSGTPTFRCTRSMARSSSSIRAVPPTAAGSRATPWAGRP